MTHIRVFSSTSSEGCHSCEVADRLQTWKQPVNDLPRHLEGLGFRCGAEIVVTRRFAQFRNDLGELVRQIENANREPGLDQ
jgi:hypothetical protein